MRSYDLVWLLHLVGDAHQPLHAVGRFTKQIPSGDAGGNAELVIPATGETIAFHAYWDRMFGGYSSPYGAVFDADDQDGLGSVAVNDAAAKIDDPQKWIEESAELAKQYVYASPVSLGRNAVLLTRDYETNARNIARSRRRRFAKVAPLAGQRTPSLHRHSSLHSMRAAALRSSPHSLRSAPSARPEGLRRIHRASVPSSPSRASSAR